MQSKARQDKVVIIPKQFREFLLQEWKLQLYPPDYYLIGQNGVPGLLHLGSNNLRNRFNIIRDKLELPKEYKLYSWKHTGNARAADAGISAYHRQKQNGHSSMRSLEEYLKNTPSFDRRISLIHLITETLVLSKTYRYYFYEFNN